MTVQGGIAGKVVGQLVSVPVDTNGLFFHRLQQLLKGIEIHENCFNTEKNL